VIVLDASALIAALSASDAHHLAARGLLARCAQEDGALIHPLNLAEVLVGPSRCDRETAASMAISGAGVETIVMDSEAPLRLARIRASTGLPLPDCCALDSALQTGCPIATFDARLARAATTLGIALAA